MFNILLYSSFSPLIQPQPQVPAALWLLMARDEKRGTVNPLIMSSAALLRHCCCCLRCPRAKSDTSTPFVLGFLSKKSCDEKEFYSVPTVTIQLAQKCKKKDAVCRKPKDGTCIHKRYCTIKIVTELSK